MTADPEALAALDRFANAFALDLVVAEMDDEDRREFLKLRRTLLAAMSEERLTITAAGAPVFIPSDGKGAVTFYELNGVGWIALAEERAPADAALAVLARLTRQPAGRFDAMPDRDAEVCRALLALIMA